MYNHKIDAIEILPVKPANASVIWLHGLGASGDDFIPITKELHLPNHLNIRFIFPHAPIKPITINNGARMRGWYDIKDFKALDINQEDSHEGLIDSKIIIDNLINREISLGINSEKIVLAGFSQGGALALHAGLRFKSKLAGIICLSGYLPWHHLLMQEKAKINTSTSIFMAHGELDQIVPMNFSKNSYNFLQQLGYNILWHSYLMQHTVVEQEIIDIDNFLNQVLA